MTTLDISESYRAGALAVGITLMAALALLRLFAGASLKEIAAALLSVPIPLTVRDPRRVARALNEAGAAAVADTPERFGLLAALPLPDVEGALG